MDLACMIPYSQKLLSLAVYDESKRLTLEFRKQYQRDKNGSGGNKTKAPSSASLPSSSEDTMTAITMMTDPVATRRLSDMRVQALDEYLRPSLIPNNRWSDIESCWRYHVRIVAWARKEFLISKYGPYIQEALVAYPQLRNSPQLSMSTGGGGNRRKLLLDLVHRGEVNTDNIGGGSDSRKTASPFLQLPATDIILEAFRMKEWSNEKNFDRYVIS